TVVEPGYFRTDFLVSTSLVESQHRIGDYAGTAGAVRSRAAAVSLRPRGAALGPPQAGRPGKPRARDRRPDRGEGAAAPPPARDGRDRAHRGEARVRRERGARVAIAGSVDGLRSTRLTGGGTQEPSSADGPGQ